MPQFQLDNFIPQLAWLALFFAILYFGIVRMSLPRIGRVIGEREQTVETDLSAAEGAKGDAETIRDAYEQDIATARGHAQTAVAAAKADVARSIEGRLAKINAELEEKTIAAQTGIAGQRDAAMGQVARIAEEAAQVIVERLTGRAAAKNDVEQAVTAAIVKAA